MSSNLPFLLVGGLFCLLGLTVTGVWALLDQKQTSQWVARRDATISAYLKPKFEPGPTLMLATRYRDSASLIGRVHLLFGWREDRRSHYPITWWGIATAALGPSIVGALLATRVLGVLGWVFLPIIDLILTRAFLNWCVNKISRALLSQFPDALSMVSRSVRVGVPLGEAIKVVAREGLPPTRDEFARTSDAVAIGVDLETALTEMAERNDLAEYRFFATALALQNQTGGGLTETLDTLADTIRKREAARKRGAALASEAKTSIYVLTALPLVSGAMLWISNPDYINILFVTPSGQQLLAIAVFMLCIGLFSMQQIIKRSLS